MKNINKKARIGLVILVSAFSATGCVSTGEFDKMQAGKNEEINLLQEQKASLEQQRTALEQNKATLEQDNAAIKQQLATQEQHSKELQQQVNSLEQQNTSILEKVGTLEMQKDTLLTTSQQRQQQYDALVQGLSKEVAEGKIQVKQYQNMLSVDLAEQIFFDSGKAQLKKDGKAVLKKVGMALKEYENKIIRVVGHTDNVPLAKSLQATYPTNWELSVARATNVVRFLQDVGIPPERLISSGRGKYDPVAPNDTPEGRKQNRRIEIMLIDKALLSEMERQSQ